MCLPSRGKRREVEGKILRLATEQTSKARLCVLVELLTVRRLAFWHNRLVGKARSENTSQLELSILAEAD
jgi:hypothetical protein